jgi:hypothetical protein
MASPVAVRQPLTQRPINTTFYPPTMNTTTTATRVVLKPLAGQKRTHSHIASGQENINLQQQILSGVAFKAPVLPTSRPKQTTVPTRPVVNAKPIIQIQTQSQFKQPLSKPVIVVDTKSRQRQETHDPGVQVNDVEMVQWRKAMRHTISVSTFYFDGLHEEFKDQATRWLNRHGGVISPRGEIQH